LGDRALVWMGTKFIHNFQTLGHVTTSGITLALGVLGGADDHHLIECYPVEAYVAFLHPTGFLELGVALLNRAGTP